MLILCWHTVQGVFEQHKYDTCHIKSFVSQKISQTSWLGYHSMRFVLIDMLKLFWVVSRPGPKTKHLNKHCGILCWQGIWLNRIDMRLTPQCDIYSMQQDIMWHDTKWHNQPRYWFHTVPATKHCYWVSNEILPPMTQQVISLNLFNSD